MLGMSIGVSIIVFILTALIVLCIVMLIANLGRTKLKIEDLPECARQELLKGKMLSMRKDLQSVGDKYGLTVSAKTQLGEIVHPARGVRHEKRWKKMLAEESVDFVMADAEKGTVKLVVMSGESSNERKDKLKTVEKACEMAKIPVLTVREYNLAGLEKAINQKTKLRAAPRQESIPVHEQAVAAAAEEA